MTIGQVKSAESVHKREESFYRIRCWEHKTTQSFGSANVVVPFQIFAMLLSYVDSVRAEATDDDLVFLSSSGKPIAKAGSELQHLAKALGEDDIALTPSINRKIIATQAAASLEDDKMRRVATHMTHDVTTAKKYYHIQKDKETAVDAFQLINRNQKVREMSKP